MVIMVVAEVIIVEDITSKKNKRTETFYSVLSFFVVYFKKIDINHVFFVIVMVKIERNTREFVI